MWGNGDIYHYEGINIFNFDIFLEKVVDSSCKVLFKFIEPKRIHCPANFEMSFQITIVGGVTKAKKIFKELHNESKEN